MSLGFLHRRTGLPLFRSNSSYALSTLRNGRIAHATRLQVANASHFARRVNSGKSPTVKIPGDAPQTVESWSRRAPVPPKKGSWKSVVILLYLAGPCVALYTYVTFKPIKFDAENWEIPRDKGEGSKRRLIDFAEVQKHNSKETGVWVVIHNQVYDLTPFLNKHPGGAEMILAHAGKNATQIFSRLHSNNVLSMLEPEQALGFVDLETLPKEDLDSTEDEDQWKKARANIPPLSSILNLNDMEEVAKTALSSTVFTFYSSTGEDGWAHRNNLGAFNFYWFRPRVMRAVAVVDPSTTMLGIPTPLPVFVSPAAMAGLGHPDGECNITRGAGAMGIIHVVSSHASRSMEDIAAARREGQALFFQFYIHSDRSKTEKLIRKIDSLGFKAVVLTVDAPVFGRREQEMRNGAPVKGNPGAEAVGKSGVAASSYVEANLQWSDVAWLKSITKLPIVLKGVQTVEDVELAVQHGASGVILSNHGGRQLDYAPAPIDVLYELRQRRPDLLASTEVYVDGGIRRGTDVVKAIALGAKAVGVGRPFLFANGAYGELGIVKVIRLLEDEIARSMRLLGVRTLDELTPDMVQYMDRTPPRGKQQ